jgi:hypothetical protein
MPTKLALISTLLFIGAVLCLCPCIATDKEIDALVNKATLVEWPAKNYKAAEKQLQTALKLERQEQNRYGKVDLILEQLRINSEYAKDYKNELKIEQEQLNEAKSFYINNRHH